MAQETLNAWDNFMDGLHSSPYTRFSYSQSVERYQRWADVKTPDELLVGTTRELEDKLAAYIRHLTERGLKYNSKNRDLSAIRKFYIRNRISLNWEWLSELLGSADISRKDRAYAEKELALITGHASSRLSAAVLLMSSAGVRAGTIALSDMNLFYGGESGLDVLKVKHLQPMKEYRLFAIKVYPDTGSEYITFCTPQAAEAIMKYLNERKAKGEKVGPESWLFCSYRDPDIPMSKDALDGELVALLKKLRVRMPGPVRTERQSFQLCHGFRKRFNTVILDTKMDRLKKEVCLGHRIRLEDSYYRPTLEQLLVGTPESLGYLTAVEALTVKQ